MDNPIVSFFYSLTERLWKEFSKARPSIDIRMPEKVLIDCKELVLIGDKLEEVPRLPGENDVCSYSIHSFFHLFLTK